MSIFKRQPPKHQSSPPPKRHTPPTLPAPEPEPEPVPVAKQEPVGEMRVALKDHGSPLDASHCHECGAPSIAGGSFKVDGRTAHICPSCKSRTRGSPDALMQAIREMRKLRAESEKAMRT